MTIRIGLSGTTGKMGQAVSSSISNQHNEFALVASLPKHAEEIHLVKLMQLTDIVIDFSAPEALDAIVPAAITAKVKLLVGTTGLEHKHFALLEGAASHIPVLYAPNTSISACLLTSLAGKVAKILPEFDVEIIDKHHKYKKDAPSGTAIAIGQSVALNRKQIFEQVANFDRTKHPVHKQGEIGFSSIRAGEIIGEHEVFFVNQDEMFTLGARALSRQVFAEGALFAAKWLNSQNNNGLYSMQDVINILD